MSPLLLTGLASFLRPIDRLTARVPSCGSVVLLSTACPIGRYRKQSFFFSHPSSSLTRQNQKRVRLQGEFRFRSLIAAWQRLSLVARRGSHVFMSCSRRSASSIGFVSLQRGTLHSITVLAISYGQWPSRRRGVVHLRRFSLALADDSETRGPTTFGTDEREEIHSLTVCVSEVSSSF